MARILLVENLEDWLGLISRSLPEHEVDTAQSYDEALLAIQNGPEYDVAIVDINLIDSPGYNTKDRLGSRILRLLQDEYPATRRIAMTAYASGAVRQLLDQYDVDDLLLKGDMELAVVSEVVEAALARTSDDVPRGMRSQRSVRRAAFRRWHDERAWQLDQRIRRLRNDFRGSGLMPVIADSQTTITAIETRLATLKAQQEDFGDRCSEIEAMINRTQDAEDVLKVEREIDNLKRIFGTDGDVPEP